MITVLITSSGGSAGINCIKSLRDQTSHNFRIVSVDHNPYTASRYMSDKSYIVPKISSSNYLSKIMHIAKSENVEMILPTNGDEIPKFAKSRTSFSEQGVLLNIPNVKCLDIFNDKWNLYNFLELNNIPTPKSELGKTFSKSIKRKDHYAIKQRRGAGSKEMFVTSGETETRFYIEKFIDTCLVQEFVMAPEYSVDILADNNYDIVSYVGRERISVKDGMARVSQTKTLDNLVVDYLAQIIKKGKIKGPANIQFFLTKSGPLFFDVNVRFSAGGLLLSKEAGLNIPLNTILLAFGLPPSYSSAIEEDLLMIRYYDEIFLRSPEI